MKWELKLALILIIVFVVQFVAACTDAYREEVAGGVKRVVRVSDGKSRDGLLTSKPLLEAQAGEKPGFTPLGTEHTGIDFINASVDSSYDEIAYAANTPKVFSTQPGLASGDIDGDGDLDLYLSGSGIPNKLYRNDGGMNFTDITDEAGEGLDAADSISSGAIFSDINGDGTLDLYVSNRYGANLLFMNDGQGHFTEDAAKRGLDIGYATCIAGVFDADQDGDLDFYITNYMPTRRGDVGVEAFEFYEGQEVQGEIDPETGHYAAPAGMAEGYFTTRLGKIMKKPDPDQLMINDGTGHFVDRAAEAGVLHDNGWSFQPLVSDFNNDGLIDLFITADFEAPDYYYLNNGDGTFTNHAREMLRRTSYFSMGADAGDINGDGLIDIFVGDMLAQDYKESMRQSGDMYLYRWELVNFRPQQNMRNVLYLNRGDGWMTELAQLARVHSSDWTWSSRIVDLNSSGIPELFVTNGFFSMETEYDNMVTLTKMAKGGASEEEMADFRRSLPAWITENVIFTASSPLAYEHAPDNWGMHDNAIGFGASVADYDGDGDLDIIINNTDEQAGVWRNDLENGNRVLIDLRQSGMNREAVGARVWAYSGEDVFMQDVILARGFATGESSRIHLGLGSHDKIDRLEIRWPDITVQVFEGLDANRHYTIEKADALPKWTSPKSEKLFKETKLPWEHLERDTVNIEFTAEPLLPVQRSMLGAGIGVADYDLDGNLDLYLAGPAWQSGKLFRGDGVGGFTEGATLEDLVSAEPEEMAVLWFDANGDGRQDLYISSGGIETPINSSEYLDHLLLNFTDGFKAAKLPPITIPSGSVCAADVDGDGDLDLALTSRLFPYSYMSVAPSLIMENYSGGLFREATMIIAPGLEKTGVISEAQFADLNGDGRPDLAIAIEFGSVEVWLNKGGKLVNSKTASPNGMWTSLGIGDFDNDGDMDIIAGNWGKNTKYHPKQGKPMTLIADDFDDNGTRDLVEVKYSGDGMMLPGRGRSCSGYAIDYIAEKWETWASFADATLEEIYGPVSEVRERFDAEELSSMILVNDGEGNFEVRELPLSAQFSPAYGIAVGDYNLDGNLDAFIANNFDGPQPETGRWNAGYGVVLLGRGDATFDALEPWESGIRIWEDGRGAVAADFSGDGLLDIAISVSNGTPRVAIANEGAVTKGTSILVVLEGKAPNTAGVGARLALELDDGTVLTREVRAGSGYMSSYSGPVHFGIPEGRRPAKLTAVWPNGEQSELTEEISGTVILRQQ